MTSRTLALSFENVFQRLLFHEAVALNNPEVSSMFEVIATNLLSGSPTRKGQYFDGAVGVVSTVKTSRKVEFQGEMWVGGDATQWTEPFKVKVADKSSTKQGIGVIIKVGSDRGEGKLFSAFGVAKQAEPGAAPTGGPAASSGNSRTRGGPPSVS
jgi:hypothetical protein